MNRFFEDSSQAKILSKDKDIHRALKHMSNPGFDYYGVYVGDKIDSHHETIEAARVRKAFLEIETTENVCIKGLYDKSFYYECKNHLDSLYGMADSLSEKELKYMNRDDSLMNLAKGVGGD